MREIIFSKQNSKRWQETEQVLNSKKKIHPDHLASLFIQLTEDLAYAQTYYPKSKLTLYLNQLTLLAHQKIYTSKKQNPARIYHFFRYDYPFLILKHYKKLVWAFAIFFVSLLIGAFSAANDQNFSRLIMGDEYVNKTLSNIQSGNPLGIYESMKPFPMFLMITFNNIKVAFMAFAAGIMFSAGTAYVLLQNGIMLGSFQYFFYSENLLKVSAMGIWMHGTIEIFSIVVAGAAGLVLGNSLLFPGTYKRTDSLRKGASDGIRLVFGLIPFFILAGFIESFLTRNYKMEALSILVISGSIVLLAFYFFIYPQLLKKQLCKEKLT